VSITLLFTKTDEHKQKHHSNNDNTVHNKLLRDANHLH